MSGKKFPDVLMQEIRCLLALDARNHIMTVKGAMKTDGQLHMLEKIYSGTDGFDSVIDAMIKQKGFYASIEEAPVEKGVGRQHLVSSNGKKSESPSILLNSF